MEQNLDTKKSIFTYAPDILDLINFAQYEAEIVVPTLKEDLTIRFSLLWEGDVFEVYKKSADGINPSDMLTRTNYIKLETLVESIQAMGSDIYVDPSMDKHLNLKNKLRSEIKKLSPALVEYIYECYNLLVEKRDADFALKIEPFKKKFQEKLKETTL